MLYMVINCKCLPVVTSKWSVQNVFFPNQSVTRTNQAGDRSTLAADTAGDVLLQHHTPSSPDRVVHVLQATIVIQTIQYWGHASLCCVGVGDGAGVGVLLSIMFWADLPCMLPGARDGADSATPCSSGPQSEQSRGHRQQCQDPRLGRHDKSAAMMRGTAARRRAVR